MNYKEFKELTQHLPDTVLIKASPFEVEYTKEYPEKAEDIDYHYDGYWINIFYSNKDNELTTLGGLRDKQPIDKAVFSYCDSWSDMESEFNDILIQDGIIILVMTD